MFIFVVKPLVGIKFELGHSLITHKNRLLLLGHILVPSFDKSEITLKFGQLVRLKLPIFHELCKFVLLVYG